MKISFLSLLTAVFLLNFGLTAQAQSSVATGSDVGLTDTDPLKADMKKIGPIFKALAAQVKDASQNQDSAVKAGELIPLFQDALTLVPSTISDLPADQQAAALEEYKKGIQQEIDAATALQKALLANDNATAQTLIAQMNQARTDGHDQFKPQN